MAPRLAPPARSQPDHRPVHGNVIDFFIPGSDEELAANLAKAYAAPFMAAARFWGMGLEAKILEFDTALHGPEARLAHARRVVEAMRAAGWKVSPEMEAEAAKGLKPGRDVMEL